MRGSPSSEPTQTPGLGRKGYVADIPAAPLDLGPASRAGYEGVTAWHKEAAEATWVRPRSRLGSETPVTDVIHGQAIAVAILMHLLT